MPKINWEKYAYKIKAISITIAVIGSLSTAWVVLDFPIPATAMQVEQLDKRQSAMGEKIYNLEYNDLVRQKINLMDKKSRANDEFKMMIDEQLEQLKKQIDETRTKIKKYQERQIELERGRKHDG